MKSLLVILVIVIACFSNASLAQYVLIQNTNDIGIYFKVGQCYNTVVYLYQVPVGISSTLYTIDSDNNNIVWMLYDDDACQNLMDTTNIPINSDYTSSYGEFTSGTYVVTDSPTLPANSFSFGSQMDSDCQPNVVSYFPTDTCFENPENEMEPTTIECLTNGTIIYSAWNDPKCQTLGLQYIMEVTLDCQQGYWNRCS
ncbi:hypothetical protein SAMD00019534_049070 [Acytostelium subglobosum LB1]|uniref:hypothetical protein n=1 Tax=Acytostelium subglobosum LB1 TaxID=1410327 RepID=UPI000644D2C4|nr:hypothetical protein SAMD00019534_049070 [Acytostelium subglobosum LB1]GAM21732.1 hypothetical protein SAMD00019534_049070 [Acytostelium subglobosum LB1]|eukprot:XP_012754832.1 hypothetical protein SAMD00019534_049070 [Acytostelium subglobosum LB1]